MGRQNDKRPSSKHADDVRHALADAERAQIQPALRRAVVLEQRSIRAQCPMRKQCAMLNAEATLKQNSSNAQCSSNAHCPSNAQCGENSLLNIAQATLNNFSPHCV